MESIALTNDMPHCMAGEMGRDEFDIGIDDFIQDFFSTFYCEIHICAAHCAPARLKNLQGVVHGITGKNCLCSGAFQVGTLLPPGMPSGSAPRH